MLRFENATCIPHYHRNKPSSTNEMNL